MNEPEAYLAYFGLQKFPENTPGLLFNLKDDLRQTKNVYNENPERVNAMSELLESYVAGERCAPERL